MRNVPMVGGVRRHEIGWRRGRAFLQFGLVPLSLAACSAPAADSPTFAVRDSAGIGIVESRAPLWPEGAGWTVSPEPELHIGAVEGEPPYLFSDVVGVVRFGDGGVAVANMAMAPPPVSRGRGPAPRPP